MATTQDEAHLIAVAQTEGPHGRAAKRLLLDRYEPFVRRLAKRWAWSTSDVDDFAQEARLGLSAAVDAWHPQGGASLTTLAYKAIVHRLIDYIHDTGGTIRVPVAVRKAMLAERHLDLLQDSRHRIGLRMVSIDADDTLIGDGLEGGTRPDELFDAAVGAEAAATAVEAGLSTLRQARDQEVLRRTIMVARPETDAEVAASWGVGRQAVKQRRDKALRLLRNAIREPA